MTVVVEKSTFIGCKCVYDSNGGVFCCYGRSSIRVFQCSFSDCKTVIGSGGVFFTDSELDTLILFKECNYTQCSCS
jgi:hypothetical protein